MEFSISLIKIIFQIVILAKSKKTTTKDKILVFTTQN